MRETKTTISSNCADVGNENDDQEVAIFGGDQVKK